jgi:polyadenylation factor subunit 2
LTGNDKGQFTLWNGASFNYESITQVSEWYYLTWNLANIPLSLIIHLLDFYLFVLTHLTSCDHSLHRDATSRSQVHDDSIRAGMIKYFTPHLTNVHGFQGHREACHGVSWSPNDERFVSCGDDGLVKIWDYREGKEEKALAGELVSSCCGCEIKAAREKPSEEKLGLGRFDDKLDEDEAEDEQRTRWAETSARDDCD